MKPSLLFVLCLALFGRLSAQQNPAILDYIAQYKQLAVDEMLRTGVPAAIKLAQGIHETEAGRSVLVLKSNNHFGIKCKTSWTGEKVYHDDDAQGECFRSYSEAALSYRDHSDFLRNNQRYAFLFRLDPTDYQGWAYGLKKAGYATNIKYSQILIRLIETYQLQDYTLIALGKKTSPKDLYVGIRPPVSTEEVLPVPRKILTYPKGVFEINGTKVRYVSGGTSLKALSGEHRISLARLLEYNDITPGEGEVLETDQLIFLEKKPKTGAELFHIVGSGETMYDISQVEGIHYGALLELNHLEPGMEPAEGERLYLKEKSPSQPMLAGAKPAIKETSAESALKVQQVKNPMTEDPRKLKHVVKSKETLYSICKKYGVQVSQVKDWNRLRGNSLQKGQELIIYSN